MIEAHDFIVELLRDAGVEQIDRLDLPGTSPIIIATVPGPPESPTVLLYSHYDVQPAGDESLWHTPPFEPTEIDGAIYGRGVADDKSNLISHIGALRPTRVGGPIAGHLKSSSCQYEWAARSTPTWPRTRSCSPATRDHRGQGTSSPACRPPTSARPADVYVSLRTWRSEARGESRPPPTPDRHVRALRLCTTTMGTWP